jgi:hypothetical protein
MQSIDVSDLPEPVVRALVETVRHLRAQLATGRPATPPKLPLWRGAVIGDLTREEIYDDDRD